MSRIDGRKPNASGQISTPGYEPDFGMNECGVAGPVRRLDLDVGLDDIKIGCGRHGHRRGDSCTHQDRSEVASGYIARI